MDESLVLYKESTKLSLYTAYNRVIGCMCELIGDYTLEIATQRFLYIKEYIQANELASDSLEILIFIDKKSGKLGIDYKQLNAFFPHIGQKSVEHKMLILKKAKLVDTLSSFTFNRYVLTGSGKEFVKSYYRYMRKKLVKFTEKLEKDGRITPK